jgi:hypothetical protein
MRCANDYCICIPNGNEDKTIAHGSECIYILVTDDCWWCYTEVDPCHPCFPNSTFLAPGHYTKGTVKGPFQASAPGMVIINSSLHDDCTARPPGHTITVS